MTAIISIGECNISRMGYGYRRWLFNRNDRIVRKATSRRNARTEYLYVITAEELRKRLAVAGWNRASLEYEFRTYPNKAERFRDLPYLYDTPQEASNRAHSVEHATLDDWLGALGRVRTVYGSSWYTLPKFQNYESADRAINIDLLGECVLNSVHEEDRPTMLPTHNWLGFPCTSLECMAVAMLEVVKDDAECILNVTWLVRGGEVYCFDDLLAAAEHEGRFAVSTLLLKAQQMAALYNDI